MTNPPGDRPDPGNDRLVVPETPCVPCWRVSHLLIPATHVAKNGIRQIPLCTRHMHEFKEMDQDHRGQVGTTYRPLAPGEQIRIGMRRDLL